MAAGSGATDDDDMAVHEREGVLESGAGRRIGWMTRGVEGGRPIGYLHGQPGSRRDVSALFADVVLERHQWWLFSIDRGGYGDTDPAGMDRRVIAADLLRVADHLGVSSFGLVAASMGAPYALAAAAADERIERLVLVSPHALPYDDPAIIALLSKAERSDLDLLRGPVDEAEAEYAASVASLLADPVAAVRHLVEDWPAPERALAAGPWGELAAASFAFGLSHGHTGYFEDGLRTLRPLEFDLAAVRCPVRAVHGTEDDLEPYPNLLRLAGRLEDCRVVALPGLKHFGPWLWPDLVPSLMTGA